MISAVPSNELTNVFGVARQPTRHFQGIQVGEGI